MANKDEPETVEIDRLIDQARYQLDDERGYASKLVDGRKIKLQIAVFIVGVAIFRLDSLTSETGLISWAESSSRILLFLGLLLIVAGGACIATEGDPLSDRRRRKREKSDQHDSLEDIAPLPPKGLSGAIKTLYPSDWHCESPHWRQRIVQYRTTYADLNVRNQRIRVRMKFGTGLLGVGFIPIILVFGLYAFAPRAEEGIRHDSIYFQNEGPGSRRAERATVPGRSHSRVRKESSG